MSQRWCLDAGIFLATVLPDEDPALRAAARTFLRQDGELVAAAVIDAEVANALLKAVRRGRLAQADAVAAYALFEQLPLRRLPVMPVLGAVVAAASHLPVTAYDLVQVLVAQAHERTLVTTDAKLQRTLLGRPLASRVLLVTDWSAAV